METNPPFLLQQLIGQGSFAQVYQATRGSQGLCAIKIVNRKLLDDRDVLKAFERETRLYLQLPPHPNIVKGIEVFHSTKNIYLVEELCSYGDLSTAIRLNYSAMRINMRKIAHGILEALLFINRHHLAHRDLKPENVLLTEDYTPKLCDFGLCCETRSLCQTICGTPYYCAPEVMESDEPYDPEKSDIWSFGVILYQMATGILPWRSRQFKQLEDEKKTIEMMHYAKYIERETADAIKRCLVLDPKDRATFESLSQLPFFSSNVVLKGRNRAASKQLITYGGLTQKKVFCRKVHSLPVYSPPTSFRNVTF